MGRIKTALVKRLSREVFRAHDDRFTTDFTKNKEVLNDVANMPSKKIRNVVAGYTTRMKKTQQAE